MNFTHLQRLTAATLATLVLSGAAHAQYVWLDENGRKQYSDIPPPASIPVERILKQPGTPHVASKTEDASAPPALAKPDMSLAEKNAEFRKRRTEQAEKEKKAAEEARQAQERKTFCARAHDYQRTLQSGERISRTTDKGERAYLTDEQRAQELKEAKRMLEECK